MSNPQRQKELTAATVLLGDILLADAEADPELNPDADAKALALPNVKRLQVVMLMLDGISEEWLIEQINNANRYESVGFLFSNPMDYSKNIGDTPRIKEVARVLLQLKKVRAEQLEAQAKSGT